MKKIALALIFILLVTPTHNPIEAQTDDCDPNEVRNWLIARQPWLNATEDILNAQGVSIESAQLHLYNHLGAIEDLERPACTDTAMMMTYYFYHQVQHLLECAQQDNDTCVSEMQTRIRAYRNSVGTIESPLYELTGFAPADHVDERPEGWGREFETSLAGDGSWAQPFAIGTWVPFTRGRFRVAAVNLDYQPQDSFFQPDPDTSIIAATIEWDCQQPDRQDVCSFDPSYDFLGAPSIMYVTDAGNLSVDIPFFLDDSWYWDKDGYSGSVVRGNFFVEKVNVAPLGKLVVYLEVENLGNTEELYFSLK